MQKIFNKSFTNFKPMKIHSSKSGTQKKHLQNNFNNKFISVENNPFMMCMCW